MPGAVIEQWSVIRSWWTPTPTTVNYREVDDGNDTSHTEVQVGGVWETLKAPHLESEG